MKCRAISAHDYFPADTEKHYLHEINNAHGEDYLYYLIGQGLYLCRALRKEMKCRLLAAYMVNDLIADIHTSMMPWTRIIIKLKWYRHRICISRTRLFSMP